MSNNLYHSVQKGKSFDTDADYDPYLAIETKLAEGVYDNVVELRPAQTNCSNMAQKYVAEFDWFIFPANLEDGAKKSYKSAEHSNGANWGMTKDAAQIRRDFKKWPLAGVGVPTGRINNLIDIEADTPKGHGVEGIASLEKLEAELGPLPETAMFESPSGSPHRLFNFPKDLDVSITSSANKLAVGVDVKSDGGMCIAPPSVRADGVYCWLNDLPLADLPDAWVERLVELSGGEVQQGNGKDDDVDGYHILAEKFGGYTKPPLKKIEMALSVIPIKDYLFWVNVGHEIKSEYPGDDGLQVFLNWSLKWEGNQDKSLQQRIAYIIEKWRTFKPVKTNIGAVFNHADEADLTWRDAYEAVQSFEQGAEQEGEHAEEEKKAKPGETEQPAKALFDPWAQFIVPTFPLEVLPPSLLTYVIAQAEVIGVDVSSMAMTILAACSSALSHCFALKMMRHGNWYVSPRLWVLLFGDSSKKKTPTILAATKPLKDYQDETWAEYEREKNYASIQDKDPPPPPVRYVVYDSTIEKLADLLSRSDRGILLKRDELAGWLGGMEKYGGSSHGANSDRGHYLELYDGGGRVVDRVKRGEAFIKNFSASFIGGIQPKKLVELRGLTSDGLLQRFLPNVMTETTFRKDEPCDEKAYDALLRQLLEAEPNVLTLSDEALEVMEALHRYLYDLEKHAGGLPEGFDAFVGKLAGVSGNLALVLHMISDPKNGAKKPVTAATVKDVQKLIMEFILPHALEFYECVEGTTTGSHRMRKLASWILTQGKERFVSSDLTSNIADFRGLKEWDLNQYVSPLVAAGWITPTDKGPLHKSWKVSPNVFTQFTERAKQEEASKRALAKLMNSPRKEKA